MYSYVVPIQKIGVSLMLMGALVTQGPHTIPVFVTNVSDIRPEGATVPKLLTKVLVITGVCRMGVICSFEPLVFCVFPGGLPVALKKANQNACIENRL